MKARIQRLRAEIASDRGAVERHLDEIEELPTELSPARLSDVREAASDARTPLAADLDALDRLLAQIAAQP